VCCCCCCWFCCAGALPLQCWHVRDHTCWPNLMMRCCCCCCFPGALPLQCWHVCDHARCCQERDLAAQHVQLGGGRGQQPGTCRTRGTCTLGGTEVGFWVRRSDDLVKQPCMCSCEVDAGNNQAHAERAGRALWAALRWVSGYGGVMIWLNSLACAAGRWTRATTRHTQNVQAVRCGQH
jgi:hypothetical protein